MGQFTTMSALANRKFYITKYLFMLFIVLNILSTIWIGIYNRNAVDEAKILYPDDRWTGDKGLGSSAQIWEKICITFLVFQNIANIMGIFAALQEHYCMSIIYSIIMFGCALYGAGGKYIRGSICSYLSPLIVALLSAIFAHQIRMENYELTELSDTSAKTPFTPIYKPSVPPKPRVIESRLSSKQLQNPLKSESNGNSTNGSVTEV